METTTKYTPAESRLAQLEAEGQNIINAYLKQVTVDANSVTLKKLQNQLKEVRAEQWQLFDKTTARIEFVTRFSAAA